MRFNKLRTLLFFFALLSFFCGVNRGYADTLDTQLSSNKITAGETFTISFILKSDFKSISPNFSALENDFHILSKNYGNTINMLNGVTTVKTFWQLTLEPKKTGEIIIPEIDFGNVKSASQKLVVEETAKPVIKDNQDASAFVQAEVSTNRPYIQSQVLYTFKLFYQSQLENPRVEIPQIKDATFIQVGEGSHYKTTFKDKPYFVAEKHFAFFPQKAGKISIPSFHFSASTYNVDSSRTYDPFYNIMTSKPLSLFTPALTLTVQKIPEKFQGATWLPAKNISLTEIWSVDPAEWETGNPVVRTITIEAEGLRADQIPDLSIDKMVGMNIYVDPPKRGSRVQGNTVIGSLQQKITYIPTVSQSFTIPVLKLNWWNLQTNKNAIAQLNSRTVQVKGKMNRMPIEGAMDAENTVSNQSTEEVVTGNQSEAPVKTPPFYLLIWFWIAVFMFVAWLVMLWFIWNQKNAKKVELNSLLGRDKIALPVPKELSEKSFALVCEQGNAVLAQQFLLAWAKKNGQNSTVNLTRLCESISDKSFKEALKDLEQAIYAKDIPWDGQTLLAAYQQVKKQQKHQSTQIKSKNNKAINGDPLPPLNP